MNEIAINGGDGLKEPHPALLDIEVRRAIAHAIDKDTLVSRMLAGIGKPQDTLSVSPNPIWSPEIPADKRFDFDLDESRRILDAAGYRDTDGDGVREMPGGGQPLRFRYAVRSEGVTGASTAEFFSGWMREIGIGITQKVYDDSRLTEVIGQGDYDIFGWGWTPFVDPDQMLSYFTCCPGRGRSREPDGLLQRRELVRPRVRPAVRGAEGRARPGAARRPRAPVAHPLPRRGGLQRAVRLPRHAGVPQGALHGLRPAAGGDRPGDLLEHLADVRAAEAGQRDRRGAAAMSGGGSGALIAIAVVAVALVGGAALLISRRRSADERE